MRAGSAKSWSFVKVITIIENSIKILIFIIQNFFRNLKLPNSEKLPNKSWPNC